MVIPRRLAVAYISMSFPQAGRATLVDFSRQDEVLSVFCTKENLIYWRDLRNRPRKISDSLLRVVSVCLKTSK